jgi:hypothetical protein
MVLSKENAEGVRTTLFVLVVSLESRESVQFTTL